MNERSTTEQLDFAVLVPLAQSGDSRAVNRLLLGFTPMVRALNITVIMCIFWNRRIRRFLL